MEKVVREGWGRWAVALCSWLAMACDQSGITSEMEGCNDPPSSLAADEPIDGDASWAGGRANGLVPSEQARLVSGQYESTFQWSDGDVEDFTFEISYEDGPARTNCGIPQIQVVAAMKSSMSGIDERERAWLSLAGVPAADPFDPSFEPSGWMGGVELNGRRFSVNPSLHWLPSGIRARGVLVENGVNRAGSFPADPCEQHVPLDGDVTAPTMESLVERVLGELVADPSFWRNGGPQDLGRFAPPRVEVSPSSSTCNVFGEAGVELSGTFLFENGTSRQAKGELRAIHGLEDPRVKWLVLSLGAQGPIDSTLVYPDGASCLLQGPRFDLYASRDSADVELAVEPPTFQAWCEPTAP
jgi:hypothetical protein